MLDAGNLWELLEARVAETPAAPMAIDQDGRVLTFAEYRAEAERAAAGLARLGIGAGDVVSWQLPTWLESLFGNFGSRSDPSWRSPISSSCTATA